MADLTALSESLDSFSGKSNIDSSMIPSSMWVWDSSLWSVVTANSCITSSGIEAANVLAGVSCARMTDWGSTLGDLISLECLRQGCSSYRVWFREPTRMTFSGLKLKSNMWMRPETDRTFLPWSPSIWKEFQTSGTQFLLLKAPLSFFFQPIRLSFSQNGFEFQSQGPGETTVWVKLISFQT